MAYKEGDSMLATQAQELEQENMQLKEQIEHIRKIYGEYPECPKKCEYCSNFVQHYICCGDKFVPTYDGHCCAGNRITKTRKSTDTCKAFVKRVCGKNYI